MTKSKNVDLSPYRYDYKPKYHLSRLTYCMMIKTSDKMTERGRRGREEDVETM